MGLLHSIWGNNTVLSTIMIWLNTAVYSDFVGVTCVTIGIPSRHMSAHMAMVNLALWGLSTSDQLSTIPVTNDSTMQNSLSIPRIWKHHIIFHSLTFQILVRLRRQFSKSKVPITFRSVLVWSKVMRMISYPQVEQTLMSQSVLNKEYSIKLQLPRPLLRYKWQAKMDGCNARDCAGR